MAVRLSCSSPHRPEVGEGPLGQTLGGLTRRRLAPPAVVQDDNTVGAGATGNELQWFGFTDDVEFELARALARQQREQRDTELVDEVVVQKSPRDTASTGHEYVTIALALEFLDLGDE